MRTECLKCESKRFILSVLKTPCSQMQDVKTTSDVTSNCFRSIPFQTQVTPNCIEGTRDSRSRCVVFLMQPVFMLQHRTKIRIMAVSSHYLLLNFCFKSSILSYFILNIKSNSCKIESNSFAVVNKP